MATFNLKQYQTIYDEIKAYIIAHQDRVSDFNTGSVIASEIEAFAREFAILYSEARAGFSEVLTKMPFTIFNLSKHPAQKAVGTVTFSRVDTSAEITIPIATQIATAGGVIYETTEAVTMAIADGSENAAVRAMDAGTSGNVPAGTVNIFVSSISGVDAVTNYANIGGGVNEETDAEYFNRFRAYLLGIPRSNKNGIITGAALNPALRSVSIVEHFPPRAGLYNLTLYLDDGSGTVSAATIAEVEAVIDGDGTIENPGYRSAGINVDYLAPTIVPVNVAGDVYVSYDLSLAEATSLVDAAVESFIDSLIIGQDVIRAQLQKTVLAFPWVVDLDITTPAANVAISDSQIARAGTISLIYHQVTGS